MFSRGSVLVLLCCVLAVLGTNRYYNSYLSFGTGTTMILTQHLNGGPVVPHRKWLFECLDGEALVGMSDGQDDFTRVVIGQCQFTFPYKPSTGGLYPYYPRCHVQLSSSQFFCFNATQKEETVNTFVTGIWDDETNFWTYTSYTALGLANPYKCCKTPHGYYIDYVSCYYQPVHDQYGEYYDSNFYMLTRCGTGYVITGLSKKIDPISGFSHWDFMQCCRVGYGPVVAYPPPIVESKGGTPVFYARSAKEQESVPQAYKNQYKRSTLTDHQHRRFPPNSLSSNSSIGPTHEWNLRFAPKKPLPSYEDHEIFAEKYMEITQSKFV